MYNDKSKLGVNMNIEFFFTIFFLFIIVSFIGWIVEIVYTFIEKREITNRGFLLGPYCPIYGIGALFILFTLQKYKNDIFALFIMSVLIATTLEYITSYIMEKIFRARWWDYSHLPFNLNGRVCLLNSVLFGVGALLFLDILYPFLYYILKNIPPIIFYPIIILLFIIFIIDCIVSFNIIVKFKHTIESVQKDYTGEISERVKKVIMQKSYMFRRLLFAFPNQIIIGIKKVYKHK